MSEKASNGESRYLLILTTAIPQVSEVRLYDDTWPHIVEEHPEFASQLPSLEHAIQDTISNPTEVYRSRTDPAKAFVFRSSNNLKGERAMVVPVRVVGDGTSARVTTAMFRGVVKGELLYRSSSDE